MTSEGVVKAQIRSFIVGTFVRARARRFGDDDHLLETGVLDSLGVLDLVVFLEHTYGIEIQEDDLVMQNFQTVNRIESFVQSKRTA